MSISSYDIFRAVELIESSYEYFACTTRLFVSSYDADEQVMTLQSEVETACLFVPEAVVEALVQLQVLFLADDKPEYSMQSYMVDRRVLRAIRETISAMRYEQLFNSQQVEED
jgi:hypothetical protein